LLASESIMEINYRTKEESNRIQQQEFLKLNPAERFYAFLELSYALRNFPVKNKKRKSGNFLIVIDCD